MQSFDYISEKLGVSPALDPILGMCRTLCADLRTLRGNSRCVVLKWYCRVAYTTTFLV